DSVYDIQWNDELTYGDIFLTQEYEHSVYSFELADVELLNNLFNAYEKEAIRVLEQGIVIPAYDYILKCSHTFNVLDARGAVSVSQRASYISRVRNLARIAAERYLEQRKELAFPLLQKEAAISE